MDQPHHNTSRFTWKDSRDRWRIALVVGVAVILRFTYFYFNTRNNPAFDHPIMDSLYHHEWANAILSGGAGNDAYFRGPLYPYLLAFLYKLGGSSIAVAVGFQHVVGAASCGLVYMLARESFPRAIALTAGLGAALYWVLIFFEGELLIVTTFIFLVLASLMMLSRALHAPTTQRLVVAGLLLGLAALARPSIIAFYPAIPFLFAAGRSRWLRHTATVLLAAVITVSPAMVRNYVVAGAFVPIASSGGVNFYIGNNPDSDGRTAIVPGTDAPWMGGNEEAIDVASRAAGRRLSPEEASAHYFRRGLDFVATRPGPAFMLWIRKIGLFWEGVERSNEKFIYFFWDLGPISRIPLVAFWLVGPLALVGIYLTWHERRRHALLYWFVGLYMLGVVAFFVNARLRLPVVPVLLIFAAAALARMIRLVRHRNTRALAAPAAVLIVAFVAVNSTYRGFSRDKPTHYAISYYTLASGLLQDGEKDAAITYYRKAASAFEARPSASYAYIARDIYTKLGGLYFERNKCEEAVEVLSRVQGEDEMALIARGVMATCLERLRRFEDAVEVYHSILHAQPGNANILNRLATCYDRLGRNEDAEEIRSRLRTRSNEAGP